MWRSVWILTRARSPWRCSMNSGGWSVAGSSPTTTEVIALLEWIRGHGDKRVIGIEGTGNFGAALARRLIEANEDAREVPSFPAPSGTKEAPIAG